MVSEAGRYALAERERLLLDFALYHQTMTEPTQQLVKRSIFVRYQECRDAGLLPEALSLILSHKVDDDAVP